MDSNVQRNVYALNQHLVEDAHTGDDCSNARVNVVRHKYTKPKKLDMQYIAELFRFYHTCPEVVETESIVFKHVLQQPPQFHANEKMLYLSSSFEAVVNKEYMEFAREALKCIRVMGFVPMTYVITATGYKVPRVLELGTYDVWVYYDIMAEKKCYMVTRRKTHAGVVHSTLGSDGTTNSTSSLFAESMAKQDWSTTRNTRARMQMDPRSTGFMRIDMGVYLPQDEGEADPTVIVMDYFGYGPMVDGTLKSPINALFPLYLAKQDLLRQFSINQKKINNEQAHIETTGLSDEQRMLNITETYSGSTVQPMSSNASRDEAEEESSFDIYANPHMDTKQINRLMTEINKDELRRRWNHTVRADTESIQRRSIGIEDSTYDSMYLYNTSQGTRASPPSFVETIAYRHSEGERVSMYHVQALESAMPDKINSDFKMRVHNVLGVSDAYFQISGGSRDSTALHVRIFEKTQHEIMGMLGKLLTEAYNQIYAPKDGSWFAHEYFDKLLRTHVIDEIARDYKLYLEALRVVDPRAYAMIELCTGRILNEVDAMYSIKNEGIHKSLVHANGIKHSVKRDHEGQSRNGRGTASSTSKKKKKTKGDDGAGAKGKSTQGTDVPEPYPITEFTEQLFEDDQGTGVEKAGEQITPSGERRSRASNDTASRSRAVRRFMRKFMDPQMAKASKAELGFDQQWDSEHPERALRHMRSESVTQLQQGRAIQKLRQLSRLAKVRRNERQYNAMLVGEEVRALIFLESLRQHQTPMVLGLYASAGEKQRLILERMFDNYREMESSMRITVSFVSNVNMSLEDLLARGALGLIGTNDIFNIVRMQMSMGIDYKRWQGDARIKEVYELLRRGIAEQLTSGVALGTKRSRGEESTTSTSSLSKRLTKADKLSVSHTGEANVHSSE